MELFLTDAVVLSGNALEIIADGWVLIQDGTFTAVGSMQDADYKKYRTLYPGAREESLHGCVLMPAFIDAHTHIGDTCAKEAGVGLPTIEAVSPPNGRKYQIIRSMPHNRLKESIHSGAGEMLHNGIAVIGDFREEGYAGIKLLDESLGNLPLKRVVFGEPDWSAASNSELSTEALSEKVQDILPHCSGIGIGDVAEYSDSKLAMLEQAHSVQGKILAVHAAETREAQDVCRKTWGKSEIERIAPLETDKLLVHVTNPYPEDLQLIENGKIPSVLCTRTNGILGDGFPPLKWYLERNLPFGLGSDNMMFSSPDIFREMDFISRLVRGLAFDAGIAAERQIIRSATFFGAQSLGCDGRFGSIDPGKNADCIALDLTGRNLRYTGNIYSAIVHRALPEDIVMRIYDGKIYS